MGYYLDLHFRDENRHHTTEELVNLFCEQGCERIMYDNHPEWMEVYYQNDEYSSSIMIHLIDTAETNSNCFADIRLSWVTNFESFINIIKSLIALGKKLNFYVYDSMLKKEITLENMDEVAEKVLGVARNLIRSIGQVESEKE